MNQWPSQSNVDNFYGNPRGRMGGSSPSWERSNLVIVQFPWKSVLAWDTKATIKSCRIHKKCSQSLARVFDATWNMCNKDQKVIEKNHIHLFGGSYNFRTMRGSNRLSMHSWGCAIDLDPAENGLGDSTPFFNTSNPLVRAFAAEGWTWGGNWSRKDAMHFQAANV